MNNNQPIGIFDSGVGGLTVVKEIIDLLPNEKIIYLGDTARVPYGNKSPESIKRFSIENVEFLMKHKVKLIVVACNTASSTSLPVLRKRFDIPIVEVIKPGAKRAVALTINKRIGIIATSTTIKSSAYKKEIKSLASAAKVYQAACPLFVPLSEEGWTNGKITLDIAKKYLRNISKKNIDTLVLGCTHYPLLKDVISRAIGSDIKIVDSASSVAHEVSTILEKYDLRSTSHKEPSYKFFVTDEVKHFVRIGERFLGRKIGNVRRVDVCTKS
ncbi:MAG: glutamate racemase [Candidatus Omnitrophota bacterium]